MKRAVLLLVLMTALALTALAQVKKDRFQTNTIEPDGFLGLRLGYSIQYAEDLLGDASLVRNGSKEWYFTNPDYEPYEALTVLADKGSINGFVAHVRANRIQFKDMSLEPRQNRFGTYHASRTYVTGDYDVTLLVVGDSPEFIRRITIQARRQKR
jgi:hypothetical protein